MAFEWTASFDTGIPVVDQQHHALVDMVNEVSPTLTSGEPISTEHCSRLLDRLLDYAAKHFKTEEELMRGHGVDERHVSQHLASHANFVGQVVELRAALESRDDQDLSANMLGFLIHWLSVHILDVDQRMARQITLIERGESPARAFETTQQAVPDESARGALIAVLGDIHDALRARRLNADAAPNLADFDQLTGLPNRRHFLKILEQAAKAAQGQGTVVGLLLVDVDDLTTINQTIGHARADQLLIMIAGRLREISRRLDIAARTGDDEFALALIGGHDEAGVIDAAERLFQALSQPMLVAAEEQRFSLSAGLAVLPGDASEGGLLLAAAESAQAAAKREGGACCRRFSAEMKQQVLVRSDAVASLHYAIRNGELVLHYQPQVNLYSGEIVGLEALVRWQHPTRGMIQPGQFIPLAEEAGLIIPLGEWVIKEALAQSRKWREAGIKAICIAVNLSAQHFRRPDLIELVEAQLRETGVPPGLLELELTESVMMHDPASSIRIIDKLHGLGVKLSLDDFGTGYSSLAYLSRFPIDKIKIDQSFIRDITTNPVNASIVIATIAMAHKLVIAVIAEGVETAGQMNYLRRNECDEMQGYFFSRPAPPEAITDMMRTGASLSFGEQQQAETPCLLLVDDEANILSALKRLLRREGYRILTAESGARGLELLAANRVEVILSDQRMPEMTGTEFLSRVKALYPDTVRMVLSGYSELASVTEAVNRGAIYKYLSKPWEDNELKREIRYAFRHQKEHARS